MTIRHVLSFSTLAILTLISGCNRYSVAINDNVVYDPPPLFSNYSIRDDELRKCVRDTIVELGLTQAEQLKRLLCPAGNISDIRGLEVFSALEYLGLSRNQLSKIHALQSLGNLIQLDLANNQVADFSSLAALTKLTFLDISQNDEANCSSLPTLEYIEQLTLPQHCK